MPEQSDTGLVAVAEEKVRPLAAEHAAAADATRTLAPEVVDAVREAGFARHFVARSFGGNEGSFAEVTHAVVALGQACASTAWCASLSAFSSRFATHLAPEGQQAVWGAGPDAFIVTGQPPMGRATPVDGGHRVSGRWTYISGVDFADWALLCAVVQDPEAPAGPPAGAPTGPPAGPPPPAIFAAVPRSQLTVLPTWDSVGMRATSSHTVVVDDVFVPSHLSIDRAALFAGRNPHSAVPVHNVPFQPVGGLTFIAPALGAATGALSTAAALLKTKRPSVQSAVELVRASGQIDAAKLLVLQNAEVLDTAAFTPELMARNERNAAYTAETLTLAVHGLVRAAGTSGLAEGSALQRLWRDVVGACTHIALQYETASIRTWTAVLQGG